jgi:hypothetical protein
MLSDLVFRLRSLFRRNTVEAELDDELRFHFEQQVGKYIRSGMTREERGVQHMEKFASGSAIRLPNAAPEARIHDHGGADARSGSGGEDHISELCCG